MTGASILTLTQTRAAEQGLFDGGLAPFTLMHRVGESAARPSLAVHALCRTARTGHSTARAGAAR